MFNNFRLRYKINFTMDKKLHLIVVIACNLVLITSVKETSARYETNLKPTKRPVVGYSKFYGKYDNEDNVYVDGENSNVDDNEIIYENDLQEDRIKNVQDVYDSDEQYFKEGGNPENSDILQYGFMDQIADGTNDKFVVNRDPVGLPFVSLNGENLDEPIPVNAGLLESNHVEHYENVKEITNCDNMEDWIYYCGKMSDGHYFDPWNPWCGFIKCRRQRAYRKTCRPGTWMGLSNALKFNTADMCKTNLPASLSITSGDGCPKTTDYKICKSTPENGATYNQKK